MFKGVNKISIYLPGKTGTHNHEYIDVLKENNKIRSFPYEIEVPVSFQSSNCLGCQYM